MRFRKKNIVVEAVLIGANAGSADCSACFTESPAWLTTALQEGTVRSAADGKDGVIVRTLEGEMHGRAGDWLIRGTAGELYPCRPEIFAAIYETASE